MGEEIIHGAIPNASGNYVGATIMQNMFKLWGHDEEREFDLIFTDNRIIRAKVSDGITGKKTNLSFGLGVIGSLVDATSELSARVGELKKMGTGDHEAYEEQREKYQSMGVEQILKAEKHNMDISYNDISIIWIAKKGKMCAVCFKTDSQRHSYDFPAVYQDKAKQLIQTFLSDKYTDKPSIWS
jgi:hypothetical protein